MSFGLFPLDTATAPELALELEQIFGDTDGGPARRRGPGRADRAPQRGPGGVQLSPPISTRPRPGSSVSTGRARARSRRSTSTPCRTRRAANSAEVLGEIFGAADHRRSGEPSLLAPGLEPAELRLDHAGFELGRPRRDPRRRRPNRGRRAQRRRPGRARPRQRAAVGRPLEPASSLGAADRSAPQPEIRIIADDTTNSLVIRAAPREYRKIRQALEQLDILPLQVLIEATVAEVTLNDELRYGVEWFFQLGRLRADFLSQRPNALGVVADVFPGFSALFASADVRVVLNALEQVTDVNVISSPQLLVLDNQTARLQVGDQVPITVQQATSVTDADAPIVNSIELRDTGVILTVTPRVNASGLVILEIQQEVSNVVRSETETTVRAGHADHQPAPDQQHRGGPERRDHGARRADHRQPRPRGAAAADLSRIPIIGALFGTQSQQRRAHRAAGAADAARDRQRRRRRAR